MAVRMGYFLAGTAVGLALGTAIVVSRAEDPPTDVYAAAMAAGVDPTDLLGAVNTTGDDPWIYLHAVGELPGAPDAPPAAANRTSSPLGARVACIEAKESGGANVANRRGSGAVGVLQFMPATFYAHALEMGHPDWSPWIPAEARAVAAHDLALGRRGQWTVTGC